MVGTKPSYPSEQYGYIVPEANRHSNEDDSYERRVHSFKEKPYEAEANQLIKGGALWNSGIYAFKLDYMITLLMNRRLPIHYDELYKQYTKIPKSSFEIEVSQKKPLVQLFATTVSGKILAHGKHYPRSWPLND